MYLLMVDHNIISSVDLQEMIDKAPEGTDIINCFSESALLKVSEQLTPDIVIVDFAMVKNDLPSLFAELREKAQDAHIMALIDPDYYDQLYEAIEQGGIDDYMVKPIRKEDFFARVQIATKKKQSHQKDSFQSQIFYGEEKESLPTEHEFTELETDQSEGGEEGFTDSGIGTSEEYDDEEEDLFSFEEFDYEEDEENEFVTSTDQEVESSLEDPKKQPDLFTEDYKDEDAELIDKEADSGKQFDLDSDLELEPEPEFDSETSSEFSPEPDRVGEFSFDDIVPPEDENYQETDLDQAESTETGDEEGFGLFDDTSSEQTEAKMHSGEDFSSLFEDQTSWESKEPEEDHPKPFDEINEFEEPSEDEPVERDPGFSLPEEKDSEESPPESPDYTKPEWEDDQFFNYDQSSVSDKPEPGPEILRPADEFIRDSRSKEETEFTSISPEEEDKGFEELFSDLPSIPESKPEEPRSEEYSSGAIEPEESEEDHFFDEEDHSFDPELADLGPGTSEEEKRQIEENYRKSIRSELPGESADDFLFAEEASQQQDDLDYNQTMLDQFTRDSDEEESTRRSRSKRKKESKSKSSRIFTIIGNIMFVILLLIMAALSFFLIQSRITGGVPEIGGYQMYIVLSGSMSPEFDTGSLAFVRETDPDELKSGDIITFRSVANPDSLTTHRIVEVMDDEGLKFVTRGDANNVNDPNPVPAENVVGKVSGTVPYVGYLMNFVQTSQGLVLLIFVPGVLIIVFELGKIMKYLAKKDNDKEDEQTGSSSSPTEG